MESKDTVRAALVRVLDRRGVKVAKEIMARHTGLPLNRVYVGAIPPGAYEAVIKDCETSLAEPTS